MTDGAPSLPQGFLLHRFDTVGSTNDEARRLARDGAPEGTLVWAAAQSAGRGRRGHLWQSPPGNLYLSLVMRPEGPAARAPQLGFVAALALGAQAIQSGTAFLATHESFAHELHKERVGAEGSEETVYSDIFAINWPARSPVRTLRNSITVGAFLPWPLG